MEPKYTLSELDMDEISMVYAGDNPHARVMLVKTAPTLEADEPLHYDFEDMYFEDGEAYGIEKDSGRIYWFDSYDLLVAKSEDEEPEVLVDSMTLIYDPEEDDDEDVEKTLGDTERSLMKRIMDRVSEAVSFTVRDSDQPSEAHLDKGKFAQVLQASVADQAYSELSSYCSALKGALDADLVSGADAGSLSASVDEFAAAVKTAISERWTKGQLVGKSTDEESISRAAQRDFEVLGLTTGEGVDAEDVTSDVSESGFVGNLTKEADNVAGIDRSKLSEQEAAYLDNLENMQAQQESPASQAVQEQVGAEAGAESDAGAPQDAAVAGTNPDDVVGDTGAHEAPFEKMLKGLEPQVAQAFRALHKENVELHKGAEVETYVNKARGFQVLPVNPAELGPVLMRISKGQTTQADERYVLDTMRSCEEMAKQGASIFSTRGHSRQVVKAGSAEEEVIGKAREIEKAEKVSYEIALGKVKADPDNQALVSRYYEEVQG